MTSTTDCATPTAACREALICKPAFLPTQPLCLPGANIVPAHILETSVTSAQLRRLVGDARAAHMNMLRVWGGGRYFQGECAWWGPRCCLDMVLEKGSHSTLLARMNLC